MSGTISIPGYPATNRVPGVFAVVDATKANTGLPVQRALLLGQMLAAGTATAGMPTLVAGIGDAQTQFGAGSHLAISVARYRAIDTFGELWALPMADGGSSVKATGTVVFTGPATAAGVVPLYINGVRIPVAVASGDTATAVAANAVIAANAFAGPDGNPLSVVATAATGTLTLTARNAGTLANSNTIMLSYLGTANGEATFGGTNVPGLTAVITGFASGATDPTIANALANLPSQTYDFISCPYNDTTSLNAMRDFLGDAAGRWNWSEELFGHAFTAKGGTLSTRTTWSTARNDQHMTAIGAFGSPSPDWAWAVDNCAAHAVAIRADPSLPVGGLGGGVALRVLPPLPQSQDAFSAEQTLLSDGMSTYVVQAGLVRVHRSITTYQTNPGGAADNSYLDTNVPFQLMAYIRAVRTLIQSQFNQVKLVADGSRIPAGSSMVTSQTILFAVIALYRVQAAQGLVQLPDAFAQNATAQNAGGGNVRMLLPVALSNQLYSVAINCQFFRP